MGAALVILAKDVRLRIRDRSGLVFAVVVPFALTFVFSLIVPDTEDLRFDAAVVDLDGSAVTQAFADQVVAGLVTQGVVDLRRPGGEADTRAAVAAGEVDVAWILPAGFGQAVTTGAGATIEVLVSADRVLAGEVARGVAEGYAARLERVTLTMATAVTAGADPADPVLGDIAEEVAQADPVVSVHERRAGERELDAVSYLAAGMAVFFVFFTVQAGVTGMLEERQQGTLPRLLAAPVPTWAITVGKVLGAFVLGVVSMTVLAVASSLLLGAHWGHPVGVAILVLAAVVAALGVMAVVASFARTAEQAGNLQSIVALVLGMFGGVFFPVGRGVLAELSVVSPHAWFLRGVGDLVTSGDIGVVLGPAAAIAAFGVVGLVIGGARLHRVRL